MTLGVRRTRSNTVTVSHLIELVAALLLSRAAWLVRQYVQCHLFSYIEPCTVIVNTNSNFTKQLNKYTNNCAYKSNILAAHKDVTLNSQFQSLSSSTVREEGVVRLVVLM